MLFGSRQNGTAHCDLASVGSWSPAFGFIPLTRLRLIHRASIPSFPLYSVYIMNHETPKGRTLSGDEVAKHNSQESCWVIVNDAAYDVTGW